uniref:CDK5 regulatory subunit-associated protein 3 isoform X2 n=1 Tax=Geotrypetes seraphini TaxID=260995 RepID=A0A6P8NVF8_GEOSA|nr:CDK5 regulatory subunit-associated protein 3 isoform X2 [Geotrypetes seraphini]
MQVHQNLPIDIQTSKLLDWLVDRRHCNLKWQNLVLQIREKINVALQDMPENEEIRELLSGSYLHYFHCLRIVQILKGTEASTKNIFGRYSSQRMKDWQEIVSLYMRENTYLAEVASLFVRSVTYEIPSLKKQIAKCQQLQQDLIRKEEELQLGAAEMKDRYYASCKQYGIMGENVRRELLALVKELPSLLTQIGTAASILAPAVHMYQACVQFVCESPPEQVVPMLRYIQEHGNCTVYEWRTGIRPDIIQCPREEEMKEPIDKEQIDWGDFGVEPSADLELCGAEADEIKWDISLEPDLMEAGSNAIDWRDVEDAAPVEITLVETGTEVPDGVACGKDALTLLENPEIRNQFIDELLEGQTKEKVVAMAATVQDLIGQLTCMRMQHLFMILASPRYVDRVTELLRQKLKQSELKGLKKELMAQRREAALEEQRVLEPRLDLMVQQTKNLQKLIEEDLSKRYNNRPVNLLAHSL